VRATEALATSASNGPKMFLSADHDVVLFALDDGCYSEECLIWTITCARALAPSPTRGLTLHLLSCLRSLPNAEHVLLSLSECDELFLFSLNAILLCLCDELSEFPPKGNIISPLKVFVRPKQVVTSLTVRFPLNPDFFPHAFPLLCILCQLLR
jgi:hypothetical protein